MKKKLMGAAVGLALMATAWAHGPGGGNVDWNNPQFKAEKHALMTQFQALAQRKQALMQEFQQAKSSGGDTSGIEARKQQLHAEHKALEQRKHALMQKYQTNGQQKGPWQKHGDGHKHGGQKHQGWQKPAGK